jgi:LPS-assembly protein
MAPSPARSLRLVLALCLGAFAAPGVAPAQGPADALRIDREAPVALVADRVSFDETTGELVAEGAVEVYHGQRTLSAARIVYDSRAERIRADGPLVLRDPSGATLLADAADLDPELRDGVVTGARALISGGVGTLAAAQGRRIDGRYTALSRAVYSSCIVCEAAPTPLWAIRADRVIHDDRERVVYYENPVFEVLGAPVAWLPFFSHPDPTVERRTGFLAPSFLNSTTFGQAVKLPYFIEIDPSRDLTLTPFPTTRDGGILEGEYRQAFDAGLARLTGSLGLVDVRDGRGTTWQGHIFGEGRFDAAGFGVDSLALPAGTVAGFDLALASRDGYVRRYRFSDEDRLRSEGFVERYGMRDYFTLAGIYFQSQRADEPSGTIPVVLPEFALRETLGRTMLGGDLGFEASGVALTRRAGRDVRRLSLGSDWERSEILDMGLALRAFAAARLDLYDVNDDPGGADGRETRFAPLAGIEARYPLIARGETAAHIVEPIAQIVTAPNGLNSDAIPNEDSQIVEFDETNIFDVNRFPGYDRVETGSRVNLGMRYARVAEDPLQLDASLGRTFRLSDETPFSTGSGLDESASDIVAAMTVGWRPWVSVSGRLRFGDEGDIARNEARAQLDLGRLRLETAYVFVNDDIVAGAIEDRTEASVGGRLLLDRNWTVGGFARRDLEEGRFVEASARLRFRNECAAVELYLDRDFTDSPNAPASTGFGLRVQLFGASDGAGRRSALCGR